VIVKEIDTEILRDDFPEINYLIPDDASKWKSATEYCRDTYHWHPLLDAKADNSVKGPEITTLGGCSYTDFCEALDMLMRNWMVVDKHCSFHIHLSLPGVKHSYGKRFQQSMLEYILAHQKEVPACVKQRWQDHEWVAKYYGFTLDDDKYRFVAFRGMTWEFRCFGNVSTVKDAMTCLDLAIRAFQHAYRVKLGMQKPLTSVGTTFDGQKVLSRLAC